MMRLIVVATCTGMVAASGGTNPAAAAGQALHKLKIYVPPCNACLGPGEERANLYQSFNKWFKKFSEWSGAKACRTLSHLSSCPLVYPLPPELQCKEGQFLQEVRNGLDGQTPLALPEGSPLEPVKDWLHINSEYVTWDYMRRFVACNGITTNVSEAHLCWPSCGVGTGYKTKGTYSTRKPPTRDGWNFCGADSRQMGQYSSFEVPAHARRHFRCSGKGDKGSVVGFGIEFRNGGGTGGLTTAPYFTGVWPPSETYTVAPWTLGLKRTAMLSFYGGVNRRPYRKQFHREALAVTESLRAEGTFPGWKLDPLAFGRLYDAPLERKEAWDAHPFLAAHRAKGGSAGQQEDYVRSEKIFALAWETYATSEFCWQPAGDTPTRRGFFDSWLFGCLPVVSHSAAPHYAKTLWGLPYSQQNTTFDKVAVVVPDGANASVVFEQLGAISNKEIAVRRGLLQKIAPLFLWNYNMSRNALSTWLSGALVDDLPDLEKTSQGQCISSPYCGLQDADAAAAAGRCSGGEELPVWYSAAKPNPPTPPPPPPPPPPPTQPPVPPSTSQNAQAASVGPAATPPLLAATPSTTPGRPVADSAGGMAAESQAMAPAASATADSYACINGQCSPRTAGGISQQSCERICFPLATASYKCQGGQCRLAPDGITKQQCVAVCD